MQCQISPARFIKPASNILSFDKHASVGTWRISRLCSLGLQTIHRLQTNSVNCDVAIGANIQQSLDGVKFSAAKINRSEKVKTLAHLQTTIKIFE